jgi:hypothetical protein
MSLACEARRQLVSIWDEREPSNEFLESLVRFTKFYPRKGSFFVDEMMVDRDVVFE